MGAPFDIVVTRRAFAGGMGGSLALAGAAEAALPGATTNDRIGTYDLREAALRGLAHADRGDPVLLGRAEAALAQLAVDDPEGAMLVRIYRRYDASSSYPGFRSTGDRRALATLHEAVERSRAVAFRYTDRNGIGTSRSVLPLAIVHPPQGVKLLGWCELRDGARQFYVHSITDLAPGVTRFADRRLTLLRALANSEPWQQCSFDGGGC